MKALAFVGTSALGATPLVESLVEALRLEGYTVSCIKRAPDGFDLDRPGKVSFKRREAGATEVMLVGDRRLVLFKEFRGPAPELGALLARLEPVDVALVEGFHASGLPTVEICRASSSGAPRFRGDPHVIAVVCDVAVETGLPTFRTDETERLRDFVVARLGLPPR
jgi:molybdopterin-guanine dinucleotide biosynthesis protein B